MPPPPRRHPERARKARDPPPHRDNMDAPRPTTDLQRNKPSRYGGKVKR